MHGREGQWGPTLELGPGYKRIWELGLNPWGLAQISYMGPPSCGPTNHRRNLKDLLLCGLGIRDGGPCFQN